MAQPQSPHLTTHASGEPLLIQKVTPNEAGAAIPVTSPAVTADGRLPDQFSAYYDNVSPPLEWTRRLEADSYALILQDPDAPRPEPFLHWALWNIPGTAAGLRQGISPGEHPTELKGAVQGRNEAGQHAYMGPKPPPGHGVHRYHFQLFALDTHLPADPGLPLNELLNMLKAHTLAMGELVATYERADLDSPGRAGSYT